MKQMRRAASILFFLLKVQEAGDAQKEHRTDLSHTQYDDRGKNVNAIAEASQRFCMEPPRSIHIPLVAIWIITMLRISHIRRLME